MAEWVHFVASLIAILASGYVSLRLARFEAGFMEKLEKKFVSREIYDVRHEDLKTDVSELRRKVFNGMER